MKAKVKDAAPAFMAVCAACGIGRPESEYRFHPDRKWKFDFAWAYAQVALEVEGGAYSGPGHRSVGVFLKNIEKYNAAAIAGWAVLRCTTTQFESGEALQWVMEAIESRHTTARGRVADATK